MASCSLRIRLLPTIQWERAIKSRQFNAYHDEILFSFLAYYDDMLRFYMLGEKWLRIVYSDTKHINNRYYRYTGHCDLVDDNKKTLIWLPQVQSMEYAAFRNAFDPYFAYRF